MTSGPMHEALTSIPLFAGLEDRKLAAIIIISISRTRTYPKGRVIISEGDPGEACYLLLAGEVEVFRLRGNGQGLTLAWLHTSNFFGEMAVFDGWPRSASVMTTEASTLVE